MDAQNKYRRIVIKVGDVWKRVREMGKDRTKRIAETSLKSLRQEMRSMARTADGSISGMIRACFSNFSRVGNASNLIRLPLF